MTPGLRILVTGSRRWDDPAAIRYALAAAIREHPGRDPVVLVHGGAPGADTLADQLWRRWQFGANLAPPEVHPAVDHPTPLARNLHMISRGADVCLAFATSWRSGTGHCARAARAAGIPVRDHGVDTRPEARP